MNKSQYTCIPFHFTPYLYGANPTCSRLFSRARFQFRPYRVPRRWEMTLPFICAIWGALGCCYRSCKSLYTLMSQSRAKMLSCVLFVSHESSLAPKIDIPTGVSTGSWDATKPRNAGKNRCIILSRQRISHADGLFDCKPTRVGDRPNVFYPY